jgi:hypothetical protein
MASNPTPDNDDIALALAEDLADGCHQLEVTLNIKQNTEAVMRAAIDTAAAARLAYPAAVQARQQATANHAAADEAGKVTIANCRLRLVKLFGTVYSAQWASAGFPNQSTAVPDNMDQRFTLLNSLRLYFTANPASESADMEATAALCAAAHTALSNARQALNNAETAATTALQTRKDAMKSLRRNRIRGLIDELGTLMPEDDARYETFGLNVPANPTAPGAIASLTLTALGGGKVLARWDYATRMAGTRVQTRRVGIDDDFVTLATVEALEKVIEGQTPGQQLEVKVTPYNAAGDGPPAPVQSIVVV